MENRQKITLKYIKDQIDAKKYKITSDRICGYNAYIVQLIAPDYKGIETFASPYLDFRCSFNKDGTLESVVFHTRDDYLLEPSNFMLYETFNNIVYPNQNKHKDKNAYLINKIKDDMMQNNTFMLLKYKNGTFIDRSDSSKNDSDSIIPDSYVKKVIDIIYDNEHLTDRIFDEYVKEVKGN